MCESNICNQTFVSNNNNDNDNDNNNSNDNILGNKVLRRICSILLVAFMIIFTCLIPFSSVSAAAARSDARSLDDVVDGDKTLYDVLISASYADLFVADGFLNVFGERTLDHYNVYLSVDDIPDDLYNHFCEEAIKYIDMYNNADAIVETFDEHITGLVDKMYNDSSNGLNKDYFSGLFGLGSESYSDVLEDSAGLDWSWYDVVTDNLIFRTNGGDEYSVEQLDPYQILSIGSNGHFIISSGVGLSDVLIDTDGAFKALLVGAVSSSLSGAIVSVRDATVETDKLLKEPISGESGSNEETIYNTVKSISDSVLFPIAGVILAFVFAYQIYEIVCERNNMNDIGAGTFIQLILRMAICMLLIIYAWPLTEAIFDIGRWIVEGAEPIIEQNTANVAPILEQLSNYSGNEGDALTFLIGFEIARDEAIDFGQMLLLLMQGLIINIGMFVVSLIIYVIVYVRLVEIWIYCAISPIPLATMSNREWGEIGRNFIRSVAALAFQAFIIMLCLTLFNVLVDGAIDEMFVTNNPDVIGPLWSVIGYSLILVFCLFKSGSISKSIMNAH